MNSSPASVVGILDRLSIGVSRVSIRHGHTQAKARKPQPELTGFKAGLGERIWVHNHIATGMIVYTHDAKLKRDSHKGLSQIPFTVKKQKPPVLREDYWTPLCLIELPKGQGVVGRNVLQKLQEFRHRHELEWGYQARSLMAKGRRERGEVIHNQKSNAVADIAAVLAGAGRGNRMWLKGALPEGVEVTEVAAPEATESTAAAEEQKQQAKAGYEAEAPVSEAAPAENAGETSSAPATGAESKSAATPQTRTLVKANVYWSNNGDLWWARKWTDNVEHHHGLPEHVRNHRFQTKYLFGEPEQPESRTVEAEQGEVTEGEAKQESEKKGWFSWLGGKPGNSTDARA